MSKSAKFCLSVTAALCLLGLLSIPASAQPPPLSITTATLQGGAIGSYYYDQVVTVGGIAPITFSISAGALPPGLSLSSFGTITGVPTATGVSSFTVRAVDSTSSTTPQVDTQALTIAVNPAVTILPATIPFGAVGLAYSQPFTVSGGFPPYDGPFLQTDGPGPLPPGLSFVNGVIAGTPTQPGTTTHEIYAYDQYGNFGNRIYTLIIYTRVQITNASQPTGQQTQAYSAQLTASGGVPGYTFAVSAGPLPPGLSMNSAGLISGTPTSSGSFPVTFRVTDSVGQTNTRQYTIAIQPPPLDFTPTTLLGATVNIPFTAVFTPTGGTGYYVFTLIGGSLAPGLMLSSAGVVSGTPTSAGMSEFSVLLTSGQASTERLIQLTVLVPSLVINTTTLPEGVVGQAYSQPLSATGGIPPYTFSTPQGGLPPGITLEPAGTLSGTPTASGTFQFSVSVADTSGLQASAPLSLIVVQPLDLAPSELPAGGLSAPYDLQMQPSGGTPPYTLTLSGDLPPGVVFQNGAFSGTPTRPGIFQIAVTLTDNRGRRVERPYRIVIRSNVVIVTTSPLPQGTVGANYSTSFAATGDIAPSQWYSNGGLPGGLVLNASTGVLSGTPTTAGNFTFEVGVSDVTEASAVRTFTVAIVLPPLPPPVFTQIGATAGPGEQPRFGLRLNQAYPAPIDGIVRLGFAPDRFGDDPSVLFANGSRAMPFTIPAGQQDASFGSALNALQTGTVAGTITLTASVSVQGIDVTPAPAPQQTIRIAPAAPVVTRLELNRVPGGFELVVTGYSTPRQLTQAVVKLTPTSGSALATSEFPVALESVFTSYYGSSASAPYGSQFRLVIPFYVPQGLAGLASASVTLTNSVGSSSAVSVNF